MKKSFDCIEMKETLQAALLERLKTVPSDRQAQAIRDDLAGSDAPAACWWRDIRQGTAPRSDAWCVAERNTDPYNAG